VRRFIAGRRAELLAELDGPGPELKSKPLELPSGAMWPLDRQLHYRLGTVNPSQPSSSGQATLAGQLWEKELIFPKTTVQAGGMGSDAEERTMIVLTGTTADGEKQYVV